MLLFGIRPLAALPASVSFPITSDTYIDSREANQELNYGGAKTIKTVINNTVTGDGSVSRGLFHLPEEVWVYDPARIMSARVFFYVWQDNTGDRDVTLFPLTGGFYEGTGNGGAPADGATWLTCDGTNAWPTAGGVFDASHPVVGEKLDILDPDMHDRFFRWDITELLKNPTVRMDLQNHGALLSITEDPIPSSGMPRAPFTSSDDPGTAESFRPRVELEITASAPMIRIAQTPAEGLTIAVSQATPHVTHTLERAFDLTAHDWTPVASFSIPGTSTNCAVALPPGVDRVFYRLSIE